MAISWWANRKIMVTAITATVATVTTIVRFTGGFESLEIKRYDYFFSKRAISDWDQRIVIVGYTENDREKYGESAPDKEMAQVLAKLRFSSATTVGLFFNRDQKPSIAEDREKLNQQIELMDNLIRTDGGDKLSPEPDNIIRKIQLYKQSPTKPHIVYKVAKHYLQSKGTRIKENQIPPSITINYSEEKEVTINPLTVLNDGGYNASYRDLINFPVLISWPINKTGFETYSFADIINNPPPNFQDKIVIVGSMKDRSLFKVPIAVGDNNYSFSSSAEVGGIVVSNLLNQAEVPFVRTWSDPIEYLYLYGWLIVSGAWILWMCEELDPAKKWAKYILGVVIAGSSFLLCIYVISLFFFPKLWIPSVFVGRGVFFNVVLSSFACLELKVREEQQKRLEESESYSQRLSEEVARLKENILAQERLVFLGRLNAGFNHEIKNSLFQIREGAKTSLSLMSDLISIVEPFKYNEDEWDEIIELMRDNLEIIVSQVARCQEFRKKILPDDFHFKKSFVPDLIDLGIIIDECIKLIFSSNLAIDSINLQKGYSTETYYMEAESVELNFVCLSLLSNALDAMQEKKSLNPEYQPILKINIEEKSDELIIEISDNGIAIPKEVEKDIFEFFFTTKPPGEGTGLGLSLAKDIVVARYNGKIELKQISGWKIFSIFLSQIQ